MSALSRHHQRRLRSLHRSAGWPTHDAIEVDLLDAGLLVRVPRADGAEVLRLSPSGIAELAAAQARNRAAFGEHHALVERTARMLAASGRLVFRDLSLRAAVEGRWRGCRADVYSLRPSSVAEYTRPAIHEIKATRADLLADIARPEKRAAYFTVSAEFYYVFPLGLAALEEVPADCGVVLVGTEGFRPGRPSPVRPVRPGLAEWLAIARRGAEHVDLGDFQLSLEELPVTPSA